MSRPRVAPIGFVGLRESSESSATWLIIAGLAPGIHKEASRFCECSCGLQGTGYFRIDAGAFSLVGPAPLDQERTCVSGQVGAQCW